MTYSTIFSPALRSMFVAFVIAIFVAKLDSVAAGVKDVSHQLKSNSKFRIERGDRGNAFINPVIG